MPTGFNRILLGVVFFGLCIGAAFGAGAAWGRFTAPKAAAAATATTGTTGTQAGLTGANGTGTTGGRGALGLGGAAGNATPGTGAGAGTGTGTGTGTGFPGAAGFARRPGVVTGLSGTVESVSGQTLTITPSGGAAGATTTPETVTLAGTASVGTVTKSDTSTLKAGDTVIVTGQRDSTGGLSATSVLILPQGFLGQ